LIISRKPNEKVLSAFCPVYFSVQKFTLFCAKFIKIHKVTLADVILTAALEQFKAFSRKSNKQGKKQI